ncbi:MAG: ABC transporter permease [Candidatus Hydrogenedentes bacterium]|nr:ABC transporter permease [Candidatus Hydrogenedentota bacterium]
MNSKLHDYLRMAAALAILLAVFGLSSANFFTISNLSSIANQVPAAVLVAVGMTYVLIIGGIDLSVGSVLGFSGAVLGTAMVHFQLPLPLAVGLCVAAGLACGIINGLLSSGIALPSFIVTLGMMEIARGAAYRVTGSETQYIGERIECISELSVLGISAPFIFALLTVAAGQTILSCTAFGRHALAVGANEESARLSGLSTRRIKFTVYVLSGALSAMAAVIHSSRLSVADPNAGIGFELQAIAAVVIGGTSLAGGRGNAVNSFIGVLIIAVLQSGLAQMGALEPTKRLVTGFVIVAAVVLDYYRSRKSREHN